MTSSSRKHLGTLLVFEKEPFWGPELQRQYLSDAISVRSRSRGADVLAFLRQFQVDLLLIVFDRQQKDALQLLGELGVLGTARYVVLPECDSDLEWVIRELGVEAVLLEPVQGDFVASRIRRRLSFRHRSSSPPMKLRTHVSSE